MLILDVFFEALNKNYLFNEIVYENELAIQKSNGEIIKKMNQFDCFYFKHHLEETYYVDAKNIDHIDHDLDQKQLIPIQSINSSLLNVFLELIMKSLIS